MTATIPKGLRTSAVLLIMTVLLLVMPIGQKNADAASLGIGASMSATSLKQGGTVTLKATAKNGTPTYKYKFLYKIDNGSWQVAKDYSTSNTVSIKFTNSGKYTLRSMVKDSKNATAYCDMTANVAKVIQPLVNNSTISATKINYGATVKVTGKATGGDGTYYYAYQYKAADGSWVTPKSWSTQSSLSIKLPSAGYYTVKVTVKDKDNRQAAKSFTVTVVSKTGKTLTNSSTVSATKLATTENLTVTGKGAGGTQPYKYSFYYKKTDVSTWTTVKTNQQTVACSFKLSNPGFYNVKCVVIDLDGKQSAKTFTVTSTKNTGSTLVNNSKLNVNTSKLFEQNSTIKMQAVASGGTQPYQYAYYYKIDSGSFQAAKAYSQTTEYSLKLSKVGKYTLRISIKDTTGKVVNKDYTVETIAAVSAAKISSMSATKTVYGFNTKVMANNAGSGAKYAFYYKKSGDTQWECLQAYSTNRTVSVRPRYLERYIVRAYTMKDSKVTTKDTVLLPEIQSEVYREFELINQYRVKNGVPKLTLDTELCFLASVRAEELSVKYSHIRPNGSEYDSAYFDYSIDYRKSTAENIGGNFKNVNEIVNEWMTSPGHRAKILNKNFTRIGISVDMNTKMWSQEFSN